MHTRTLKLSELIEQLLEIQRQVPKDAEIITDTRTTPRRLVGTYLDPPYVVLDFEQNRFLSANQLNI